MKTVQSFDIFDTLLARSVKTPTDIFDIIESKFPYNNFKIIRMTSEKYSNGTIEHIYYNFKLLTNENDETINKLREFELQTEMENTIPILSNILKIKDGDIFVSDMYLSHDEIIRLLNYHSINPNITLYVSAGDKSSGEMWNKLIKEYNFISHIGDNYYSDITMSSNFGINGIYTQIHKFSAFEEYLINNNQKELCTFFRKFRLMNPYDEKTIEYKIYDEQIQYNIPLLLFMCKKIVNILISENRNKVLFLTRDGCLIYKLFSFLYPEYISIYFNSSRIINKTYNNEYVNYLKKNYNEKDCLLFDLNGSFKSGRKIFLDIFGNLPRIFIYNLNTNDFSNDKITYITNICPTIDLIETMNKDICGTLISFKDNKFIRTPPCENIKYIQIIHNIINQFIKYITNKSNIIDNNIFEDNNYWINYTNDVLLKYKSVLYHNYSNNDIILFFIANKYNSYKSINDYTYKYQEIISDILDTNILTIFDLLEIGLNKNNANNIPSLLMWHDYFNGKNINITGFDINPNFLNFNSKYDNINIIIGDQSDEKDLQKLKMKTYDIIIDDGYHASKHQQISFKVLWSNIKSGGYYVIEHLYDQPEEEYCIKTRLLFENWKNGNWIETEYINNIDIQNIKKEIKSINFFNSKTINILNDEKVLWGNNIINDFVYIKKI